jgi:regulator of protease activity HflC (stomatin/prohibitin superfamily)
MVIYRVAARAFPAEQLGEANKKIYVLDVKTKDGQNVQFDFTLLYALRANEVPQLHQQIGMNYEDQIILPQIRSEARLAIGSYAAEEIYQGKVRDEIQQVVKAKLVAALVKYPAIQINDALIRNFTFSAEFERAIEQKKLAAQQVEINKNKALAQEEEAKRQEAEARGSKLMVVQKAEGDAAALKINADASRYALEQEAAGKLAQYKAEAEGKRLSAEALGGGKNVVALKFAEMIPPTLKVYAIPVGSQSATLMNLNDMFGGMFKDKD